jgi:HAE1 family hydrophobic/amphiphilic exporter-1
MILPRFVAALTASVLLFVLPAKAQNSSRLESLLGIPAKNKPASTLPPLQDFQDCIRDGKLVLSLEDAIRLALVNNTDVRLDRSAIDRASNNVLRQFHPFDPTLTTSFNDQRSKVPGFQQLQGASVLNTLSQTAQFNYNQTFETGTHFQSTFYVNKNSTNSSFFFLNPYYYSSWQFQVTQPLLRNYGLFYNRAPIVIAQRNVRQARAVFEGEVSDILLLAINGYWNVVLQRKNLVVQRKSLEEAQQSYERDKRALSLGALPPLDIYRPESQVAARRVSVIQAEYALTLAEDQFRYFIGADRDPAIRVLDLDLTEEAKPAGELLTIDIPSALSRALTSRPEFEAVRQQLTVDDLKIRLAHNQLRPDLELMGVYSTIGVGGNQLSLTRPPVPVAYGGLTDSLSQIFHFDNPTYGFALTLTLPIKNRGAQADLGDALVSRQHDQYQQVKTTQTITLDVANAVHQLEQAKLALEAATVSVDLAQKNLQAEERKHELGSETAFFVLDAQTQLAQAEFSLAQAQTNYQLALASLDHATGELLVHHYVQLQPAPR